MSRFREWVNVEEKKSFSSFLKETGNPTGTGIQSPGEKAAAMGLQSDGHGGYRDSQTGQLVARTVNGELAFYDPGPSGGIVADGNGGAYVTQAQPSWRDPRTGMAMTPPSRPESKQEINSVPHPTPAKPPLGFNAFMQMKQKKAYDLENPEPMRKDPEQEAQGQQPDPSVPGDVAGPIEESEDPGWSPQAAVSAAMQKVNQPKPKAPKPTQPVTNKIQQQVPAAKKLDDITNPEPQPSRHDILKQRLDNLTASSTLKSGAGANELSLDDIGKFRNYLSNGPQNDRDDVSDEDMDFAMDYLKTSAGDKWKSLQGRLKGKGDPEPARKVVSRAREIVMSYLQNHGQSAIDGESLPFSDSELDHGISLSNGGEDIGDNWRWLPKRYNQFKGDLNDDDLLAKLDAEEKRQNDPDYKLKRQEDELTNTTRDDWRQRFEGDGWENLNVADIRQAKGKQGLQLLKSLAEKSGVSYYKDRGKARESGRAGGGTSLGVEELQDRLIDQLGIPDQVDVDNFDKGLFDVLQRIEDKRFELDQAKRARRKEKRDAAKKSKS